MHFDANIAQRIVPILLICSGALGQIPPDSYLFPNPVSGVWGIFRFQLDSSLTITTTDFWPAADGTTFGDVIIDPRTGGLWGLYFDWLGTNQQYLFELRLQNGMVVQTGRQIVLPRTVSGNLNGIEFDENGKLILAAGMYVLVCDLDRGTVQTHQLSGLLPWWYTPARAGRPAIAIGWEWPPQSFMNTDWLVVSLDPTGQIIQVFYREPATLWSWHQLVAKTTREGRTFIAKASGSGNAPNLGELDYQHGTLINRLSGVHVGGFQEDPSRGLLYLWTYVSQPGGSYHYFANYDLTSNGIVNTGCTQNWGFLRHSKSWHPADQINVYPKKPDSGRSFSAHLTLGGHPGELGLILFRRAIIGGVPLRGLSCTVSIGAIRPTGVHYITLPYQSALYPMTAGDALAFEGFLFNGQTIRSTGECAMRWQ